MKKIEESKQSCAICHNDNLRCDLVRLNRIPGVYPPGTDIYNKEYAFFCSVCNKYVGIEDW